MNNQGSKLSLASTPALILAVALAYAATARASFLFTIPPGNITAFFPAAGLALAAALTMGETV